METSTFEFRSEFLDLSFIYYPAVEGILGGGKRSRKEKGKVLSKSVVWSWV